MKITPLFSTTFHKRSGSKEHSFRYNFLSLMVEVGDSELMDKPWWLSVNKLGFFSFYESDYFRIPDASGSLKERLSRFLGFKLQTVKILGGIRFLNYLFNPLTLYFVTRSDGQKIIVGEIWNTFGEFKPFVISENDEGFKFVFDKNFYISPFMRMDSSIKIDIEWPDSNKGKLSILSEDAHQSIYADWTFSRLGNRLLSLFPYSFKVSFGIHFQALVLFLKGIKFYKKTDDVNLQKGFFIWKQ